MNIIKQNLADMRVLVEKGWCQGIYFQDKEGNTLWWSQGLENPEKIGACCLTGAIDLVSCLTGAIDLVSCLTGAIDLVSHPKFGSIVKVIRSVMPEHSPPLHVWNDAPGRTKEEVLALLDKAIASLE